MGKRGAKPADARKAASTKVERTSRKRIVGGTQTAKKTVVETVNLVPAPPVVKAVRPHPPNVPVFSPITITTTTTATKDSGVFLNRLDVSTRKELTASDGQVAVIATTHASSVTLSDHSKMALESAGRAVGASLATSFLTGNTTLQDAVSSAVTDGAVAAGSSLAQSLMTEVLAPVLGSSRCVRFSHVNAVIVLDVSSRDVLPQERGVLLSRCDVNMLRCEHAGRELCQSRPTTMNDVLLCILLKPDRVVSCSCHPAVELYLPLPSRPRLILHTGTPKPR